MACLCWIHFSRFMCEYFHLDLCLPNVNPTNHLLIPFLPTSSYSHTNISPQQHRPLPPQLKIQPLHHLPRRPLVRPGIRHSLGLARRPTVCTCRSCCFWREICEWRSGGNEEGVSEVGGWRVEWGWEGVQGCGIDGVFGGCEGVKGG